MKKVIIPIVIIGIAVISAAFIFKDRPKLEDYLELPERTETSENIYTYDEVDDEVKEVSQLLHMNGITGNITKGVTTEQFVPEEVVGSVNGVYYTCYDNGKVTYVIMTDNGWSIINRKN